MNIYQLCHESSVDISDVAQRTGIPDLKAIAENERNPTGAEMVRIAQHFGITVQSLLLGGEIVKADAPAIIPKRYQGMEECQFCGAIYHPMMRWSKGGTVIFVCSPDYHKHNNQPDPGCRDQARELGFEPRPDLTPTR